MRFEEFLRLTFGDLAMTRFWFGTLVLTLAAPAAVPAEIPKVSGPPPRFAIVAEVNQRDKTIDLLETVEKIVPAEEFRRVEKNGMVFVEKITVYKKVMMQVTVRVALT